MYYLLSLAIMVISIIKSVREWHWLGCVIDGAWQKGDREKIQFFLIENLHRFCCCLSATLSFSFQCTESRQSVKSSWIALSANHVIKHTHWSDAWKDALHSCHVLWSERYTFDAWVWLLSMCVAAAIDDFFLYFCSVWFYAIKCIPINHRHSNNVNIRRVSKIHTQMGGH